MLYRNINIRCNLQKKTGINMVTYLSLTVMETIYVLECVPVWFWLGHNNNIWRLKQWQTPTHWKQRRRPEWVPSSGRKSAPVHGADNKNGQQFNIWICWYIRLLFLHRWFLIWINVLQWPRGNLTRTAMAMLMIQHTGANNAEHRMLSTKNVIF